MLNVSRFFTLLICLCINIHAYAQSVSNKGLVKTYTTKAVTTPPEIDGLLNDESWNAVEWAIDFIELEPDENTPPSEQTKFKIVYDERNLYVGIRAFDSATDSIVKRLSRRDGFVGDRVSLVIDSYHDLRTAFIFTVTVAGVKGDEIATDNGNGMDDSWNPIWYTKTAIDDNGWTAEMKIPLSQLRFGKSEAQVWGLNLARTFFRNDEMSVWNRVPADAAGFISESGLLVGLKNLIPQKQFEIQPFTVAKLLTYPAEGSNPYRDGNDFSLNGGVDAKIGVTNDLTLDFTINPDFGQVEADPSAITLDGFQIFFEEKRPFFVENKNIFDYRFGNSFDNIFYSRRIGGSPHGSPDLSDGEYADEPTNSTILGAAKFSGKTKNGWSIGLLESVTGKMYAEIANNGQKRDEIVEPFTNYLVARTQKDFNNNNSYIGGIFTATNRNLKGNFNDLRKAAFTGGIDFRHSWKNRNYFVEGNVIASRVTGSKEAIQLTQESLTHLFQRVDANHVAVDANRTSLAGTGGKFEGGKVGGGKYRYNAGVEWRSPELELNDIGFLRQADDIRQFSEVGYELLKPTKTFRDAKMNIGQFSSYDFDGNFNRIQYDARGFVKWKNNWWTEGGFTHKPRIFINTFLRGGPRFRFSEENFGFLFFGSDQSKKFNFTLGYVKSAAQQHNFSLERYVVRFNYQPIDALSISLNTEFETNPNKTQYVTQEDFGVDERYILGNIDQQTWNASLRLNYSINPDLSIQYYGQPFISRGRYSNFNFVNNPVAEDLNERVIWYGDHQISKNGDTYSVDENSDNLVDYEFDDPDFSFVQFRSNLVVRWEYTPGSEVYLVWSQGVTGNGDSKDTLISSLDNEIFKKRPENTFLIKATYRFML